MTLYHIFTLNSAISLQMLFSSVIFIYCRKTTFT